MWLIHINVLFSKATLLESTYWFLLQLTSRKILYALHVQSLLESLQENLGLTQSELAVLLIVTALIRAVTTQNAQLGVIL